MGINRTIDGDSATRLTLAALSPITYEVACEAFGCEPNLANDAERTAFFAVWAMLRVDFADAVMRDLQSRETE